METSLPATRRGVRQQIVSHSSQPCSTRISQGQQLPNFTRMCLRLRIKAVWSHSRVLSGTSDEWSLSEACLTAESKAALIRSSLDRIREAGVIACLRTEDPEVALGAARAALDGNLPVLEVTMTTPAATEIIAILVREYPAALIGAGTILSWQEAEDALTAGAKFLLSPVALKELVLRCKNTVLFIPGAMTPTEVVNAYNWGAEAVKLYPVGVAGGVQLVSALRRPFPYIPLVVSSGVTLDMVESYINAGAIAAVLSDAIFDKGAIASKDFALIREKARMVASKASLWKTRTP